MKPFTLVPPAAPAPTLPSATRAANAIKGEANRLSSFCLDSFTRAYRLLWENTTAPPDAIVAAMNTEAVKLFTASAELAQLLIALGASVAPGMPAGWTFTANADGSATLTKTAS